MAYSAAIFFVDPQHVGRCGGRCLHVVIEGEAIELAEVARLAHAQDHRFQESVEASKHLLRRHLEEIPCADGMLDAVRAVCPCRCPCLPPSTRAWLIFDSWLLGTMGAPVDHVCGMLTVELLDVIEPAVGVTRYWCDDGRAVEVEYAATLSRDPAPIGDQPIRDLDRLARRPGHLFDRSMAVEPGARPDLADRRQPSINAGGRPDLTRGDEDVLVFEHVSVEILRAQISRTALTTVGLAS